IEMFRPKRGPCWRPEQARFQAFFGWTKSRLSQVLRSRRTARCGPARAKLQWADHKTLPHLETIDVRKCCLSLILLLTLPLAAVAADDITFERVIGPEFPGKYKHPATIEELAGGDLYIAYYGGDGEYAEKTADF